MTKQIQVVTKRTFNEIAADYVPYNHFPEFNKGVQDYMDRVARNMGDGVAAQAYDRGAEAAMKYCRQFGGY